MKRYLAIVGVGLVWASACGGTEQPPAASPPTASSESMVFGDDEAPEGTELFASGTSAEMLALLAPESPVRVALDEAMVESAHFSVFAPPIGPATDQPPGPVSSLLSVAVEFGEVGEAGALLQALADAGSRHAEVAGLSLQRFTADIGDEAIAATAESSGGRLTVVAWRNGTVGQLVAVEGDVAPEVVVEMARDLAARAASGDGS